MILANLLLIVNLNSFGYIEHTKDNVFILGDGIGTGWENYEPLIERLHTAKVNERIYIILYKNAGGWATTGERLRDAIIESKATVYTESRIWTASAALDVLFSGKYVQIPKHNFRGGFGIAHLSFVPGPSGQKIRSAESMRTDIEYRWFYKSFMTQEQWERMTAGEDVSLYGTQVCALAKHKTVDNSEYCVIENPGR